MGNKSNITIHWLLPFVHCSFPAFNPALGIVVPYLLFYGPYLGAESDENIWLQNMTLPKRMRLMVQTRAGVIARQSMHNMYMHQHSSYDSQANINSTYIIIMLREYVVDCVTVSFIITNPLRFGPLLQFSQQQNVFTSLFHCFDSVPPLSSTWSPALATTSRES